MALPPTTQELKVLIDQAIAGNEAAQKELRELREENAQLKVRIEKLSPPAPAANAPGQTVSGSLLPWIK